MATTEVIANKSPIDERNGGSAAGSVRNHDPEQSFQIDGLSWSAYTTINDALVECSNPRMIFCAGRLIFMSRSHIHEWLIDCLSYLVISIAVGLELDCEPAGETTFRNRERGAGLEGDTTFHFGEDAAHIRSLRSIDLKDPPPPSLAIEVEVSHSASQAARAWALLGVPELWRYDAQARRCTFWRLGDGGEYEEILSSRLLPYLTDADIRQQIDLAADIGVTRWVSQLPAWTRDVLHPRQAGSG